MGAISIHYDISYTMVKEGVSGFYDSLISDSCFTLLSLFQLLLRLRETQNGNGDTNRAFIAFELTESHYSSGPTNPSLLAKSNDTQGTLVHEKIIALSSLTSLSSTLTFWSISHCLKNTQKCLNWKLSFIANVKIVEFFAPKISKIEPIAPNFWGKNSNVLI